MIWLLLHPIAPSPINKQHLFLSLPVCRRSGLLTGVERRGWGGEGEKVWSSINHSILPGREYLPHILQNVGKGAPVTSDALIRSSRKLRERSFSPTREHMVTPRSV